MVTHDLLRYLKNEIEYRRDALTEGLSCPSTELPAQYNYRIAYIHALTMVQEWVKEHEARKLRDELEE